MTIFIGFKEWCTFLFSISISILSSGTVYDDIIIYDLKIIAKIAGKNSKQTHKMIFTGISDNRNFFVPIYG